MRGLHTEEDGNKSNKLTASGDKEVGRCVYYEKLCYFHCARIDDGDGCILGELCKKGHPQLPKD